MHEIGRLAVQLITWAFHFWWVWCLAMLVILALSIGIGKFLSKSGTRDDEGR